MAGVSFTIRDGEILGLVGESGSGKSVTAMSIAGLLPRKKCDYRGDVLVDGEDMGELRIDKGEILIDSSSDPSHKSDPSYTPARKYLRNGLLFIERNGITYTAQGQRLD